METWLNKLGRALIKKTESEILLDEAAQELIRAKGFNEITIKLFGASWGGGSETIITFNNDGEMADIDVVEADSMTKEDIVKKLLKNLSFQNQQLLMTLI